MPTTQLRYALNLPDAVPTEENDLVRNIGEGLSGQAFPRYAAQGSTILTTSVVQATGMPLRVGDRVSNIVVGVSVNSAAGTLCKVGLYDKSGVLLASSADIQASFNSGSTPRAIVGALTTPYVVPRTDLYYPAIVSVSGTPPTLLRGVNLAASSFVIGTGQFPHWQAAAADLTTPLTPAATGVGYWFGWN
jgi:hypothetical protein